MDITSRRSTLAIAGAVGFLALATLGAQAPTVTIVPANPTILVGQTQQFTQSGALTVADIAAGAWHTCLLLSDRSLQCVGRNSQGQLGNGTLDNAADPVAVGGLTNAVGIRAGMEHTCALIADGTMQCWGANYTGQLGIGSAGEFGGVGYSWSPTPVQDIANAIAAVPGGYHTCAVLSDHTVQCWGRNQDGQVGNGDRTTDVMVPVPVMGLGAVASLAAGGYHTCALMPDGTVRCWGRNDDGQLGTGDWTSSSTPVQVSGLRPAAVSTGGYHTCALLQDGTVQCWGRNDVGQVGQPANTGDFLVPTTVPGITNAVAVVAGVYNTCAVLAGGTARCWGQNIYGEVGDGTTSNWSAPDQVLGINGASAVAVGGYHTCALVADSSVRCWGENDYGELGNGTTVGSPTAVKMYGTGLTWTSNDSAVATIDATGRANAVARGTSTITATDASGTSGSTTLTVKEMLALSVARNGDGAGAVTSDPAGINCGASCSASYLSDSQVTLTAAPAANSTLTAWAGCDEIAGATCTVTMSSARLVTATVDLKRFTLAVTKSGIGHGTVKSSPGGIDCGLTCSSPYVIATTVTLTATPAVGSVFLNGWTGCNAVSGTFGENCTVTMSKAIAVNAEFAGIPLSQP